MKYIIIDSCFFTNIFLRNDEGIDKSENDRIKKCKLLWKDLITSSRKMNSIIYISDLCVAETFKTIAKKYYYQKSIKSGTRYQNILDNIEKYLRVEIKHLKSKKRKILIHDIAINRDILVGASRFLEIIYRNDIKNISTVDLVILSLSKYLIDFYRIAKTDIQIISLDNEIIKTSRLCDDIPAVINPVKISLESFRRKINIE